MPSSGCTTYRTAASSNCRQRHSSRSDSLSSPLLSSLLTPAHRNVCSVGRAASASFSVPQSTSDISHGVHRRQTSRAQMGAVAEFARSLGSVWFCWACRAAASNPSLGLCSARTNQQRLQWQRTAAAFHTAQRTLVWRQPGQRHTHATAHLAHIQLLHGVVATSALSITASPLPATATATTTLAFTPHQLHSDSFPRTTPST